MPGIGLGLGLGLTRGGGGAATPAQQIIDLATADGWAVLYDPTNPNTRTLRESGGSSFITQIADGLGNKNAAVQATEANQPELIIGQFGDLDGGHYPISATKNLKTGWTLGLSQPFAFIAVASHESVPTLGYLFNEDTDNAPVIRTNIDGSSYELSAGTTISGGVPDLSSHVYSGVFNGASSVLRIDAAEVVNGNSGAQPMAGITIGNLFSLSVNRTWEGHIGPMMFRDDGDMSALTRMEDLFHELSGIAKA